MTTDQKIIRQLYRRFHRRPATLDERGLHLIADHIVDEQGIELDDNRIVFTEMDCMSPFKEILLDNIHGVVDLGKLLAIVLHSSIIFFNKQTHETSVHIKPASLRDRLTHLLSIR